MRSTAEGLKEFNFPSLLLCLRKVLDRASHSLKLSGLPSFGSGSTLSHRSISACETKRQRAGVLPKLLFVFPHELVYYT
jgi:hypothetical protein